ncbi:hypothetical protein HMN09_01389000 [Mycena chlorophos]|uniref:Uncharacterized protein n=1 Tax=Mycena chlorophos TaxID=658473 RepID=A0A8H6RW84_MYCCL|nr:hypothetical protein HMN09_01389000 [Mycena chlorophos]
MPPEGRLPNGRFWCICKSKCAGVGGRNVDRKTFGRHQGRDAELIASLRASAANQAAPDSAAASTQEEEDEHEVRTNSRQAGPSRSSGRAAYVEDIDDEDQFDNSYDGGDYGGYGGGSDQEDHYNTNGGGMPPSDDNPEDDIPQQNNSDGRSSPRAQESAQSRRPSQSSPPGSPPRRSPPRRSSPGPSSQQGPPRRSSSPPRRSSSLHHVEALLSTTFRQVPPYDRAVIRRFKQNVSDLKQFAARNYGDAMQCILPVIDGLFIDGKHDAYNDLMLDVCFDLLTFHAYAKLRLHTDSTVALFRQSLVALGQSLRRFARKTAVIITVELPGEYRRRMRAKSKKASKTGEPVVTTTVLEKPFNLERIARQVVERMEAEERPPAPAPATEPHRRLREPEEEALPDLSPKAHHQMGDSRRNWWKYGEYPELPDVPMDQDAAYIDMGTKLKTYIRSELLGEQPDRSYTDAELEDVLIERDRAFLHALMHLNYTSYDMQRGQDILSPRTNCNFMIPAAVNNDEDDHPYEYGRALALLHLDVRLRSTGKRPQRVEAIWTRFYELDLTYKSGWKYKRLHRLSFLPHDDANAFGFINPTNIIRTIHLIPYFRYGRTTELLPRSVARQFDENDFKDDADWNYYALNWFVDRDMFMRYHQNAVGHRIVKVPPTQTAVVVEGTAGDEEDEMDDEEPEDARLDIDAIVAQLNELPEPVTNENLQQEFGQPLVEEIGDGEDPEEEEEEDDRRQVVDDSDEGEDEDEDSVGLVGDNAELNAAGLAEY